MTRDLEADLVLCETVAQVVKFVAEAPAGWSYAINRALEAESEVDRLRHEIDILQDQLNQRGYIR